ncbi:Asp-tRNA(Asn)/Glu-tRNA(Gln) amidotransferase subunit GatC [Cytophagales bacterium LB-30]|uniref:Aspartyl/glutamyl-tRNA(Asn/Gln) amidotransferase subunit C n=1 Tax=Shiella aurantiaca TaxID=3058365 RepID=A0ABT8F8V0_9BACT|nr:Asp-tRNA(Asn)/Glu-tRNA(Gln) amidotransferase subunit GatC [Shiella aurantiaca]MDN4166906.1 Asp-tRNA(Asn)/Glu-tRNA(Gln) amidotransferase subunit GatC [Shiella aurantiaca]
MKKVDHDTLKKMAHLSRLEFDQANGEKMINSMNEILDWVEKLNEIDTDAVAPLITMSEEVNQLREDVVKEELPHEKGLQNAPKRDSDYFRVPKVME